MPYGLASVRITTSGLCFRCTGKTWRSRGSGLPEAPCSAPSSSSEAQRSACLTGFVKSQCAGLFRTVALGDLPPDWADTVAHRQEAKPLIHGKMPPIQLMRLAALTNCLQSTRLAARSEQISVSTAPAWHAVLTASRIGHGSDHALLRWKHQSTQWFLPKSPSCMPSCIPVLPKTRTVEQVAAEGYQK